jgi:hypothetical protein
MATSMAKMAWETQYSDGSGVEFAVRYDANKTTTECEGAIEFEAIDVVRFPLSKIDWLIECLQQIKAEQGV